MEQSVLSVFAPWGNFYVIVGSAAAALTGLQFVVVALSANLNALRSSNATRAFATPTIVHFCAALLVSAIVSAPWHTLSGAGFALDGCGGLGLAYALLVIRHTVRQKDYAAVAEDWICHCVLPPIAYGTLLGAAMMLPRAAAPALFVIGGTTLLLLFVGIHNSWDSVTYIALKGRRLPEELQDPAPKS